MPTHIYTVEIDGQQYDLEGDHEPSEAEARAAVGATAAPLAPPKRATPPPASATIGMLQPSTATTSDRVPSVFGFPMKPELAQMTDGVEVMGQPIGPLPTTGAIGAVKAVPGILARAAGISKVRGAANIAEAVNAAKAVPIDPAQVAAAADEMMQFKGIERVPMVVRKLVTELQQGPMNVERARQFYPALSRMSANDFASLTPNMQRLVGGLKGVFNEAITDAAATVGKGAQYASGMKEYARAGRAAQTYEKTVKPLAARLLRRGAEGAAATAGGTALYKLLFGKE